MLNADSAEATAGHDMRVEHHIPPLNRLGLPSAAANHIESNGHQPFQPHGPGNAVDAAAMTQAGQGLHVERCNQQQQHQQQQQQQDALSVAFATAPDMPDEVVPTLNRRLKAAADQLSSEALTPVMVPHAQARIQSQHDTTATTPSVVVVKDTPQSAAAATPWSRVKDTPSNSEVTPLQRGSLPHGLWLGLDQPSASRPPLSAPVQSSSIQAASSALQQRHLSDAVASGVHQLYPRGRPQEQLDASPPELTLRLSLSDGSSTKSNKAGQPSPSRGAQPAQQHVTPPMQPNLTARTHSRVPVESVPAGSKSAAWNDSPRVLLPPQQKSLQAREPALRLQAGGEPQNQQHGQQHPAAATDSCCHNHAAFHSPLPSAASAAVAPTLATAAAVVPSTVATAAAAGATSTLDTAAAVAPTLADASYPVSQMVSLQFDARGRMQQLPQEHNPDHGHVINAGTEHLASHINKRHSGQDGSSSEADGRGGSPSADKPADQPYDDDTTLQSPEPDYESPHGASGDHSALAGSDSDRGSPDDPDPDNSDGPSATAELVPHRYKQPAPTQVSPACQASIVCHQAALSTISNQQTQHSSEAAVCCLKLKHTAGMKSQRPLSLCIQTSHKEITQ